MRRTPPHAVVIGTGLSGLAAARALRNRGGLRITLIDLKKRVGASVSTHRADPLEIQIDRGCVGTLDDPADPLWDALGLEDELVPVPMGDARTWFMFRRAQESVLGAVGMSPDYTLLMQSAVTSVGEFDAAARAHGFPRFCVCLENGTVLESDAVVIAVSAPRAERILRGLSPDAAAQLERYRFDTIARVNVVQYTADIDGKLPAALPADHPIAYIARIDHPVRVPEGMTWLQFGMRCDPAVLETRWNPDDVAAQVTRMFDLPLGLIQPIVSVWPFDEPLEWQDTGFAARMEALHRALPEGAAVAGSDYIVTNRRPTLTDRIRSGFAAAERVYPPLT